MTLTIRHQRHFFEPCLPHFVFIDGHYAATMQGDETTMQIPTGDYALRIQCGGRLVLRLLSRITPQPTHRRPFRQQQHTAPHRTRPAPNHRNVPRPRTAVEHSLRPRPRCLARLAVCYVSPNLPHCFRRLFRHLACTAHCHPQTLLHNRANRLKPTFSAQHHSPFRRLYDVR